MQVSTGSRGGRQLAMEVAHSGDAPDIAAAAALLEIGHRLGALDVIVPGRTFDATGIALQTDLAVAAAAHYVTALDAAGLIEPVPDAHGHYRTVPEFPMIVHRAGYVSWALNANRPLIEHAREFLTSPRNAAARHPRDEWEVAVSSQWMAWLAMYPSAINVMLAAGAEKIVDLGSATGRLLIDALTRMPDCIGVGIDVNPDACRAAASTAEQSGVGDRMTVHERSIQSLVDDPSPLHGSDVIHAGFVLHELLPDEGEVADSVLAACHAELRPGGVLTVAETIPGPHDDHGRRFGALIEFYQCAVLGRQLLTEAEWNDRLLRAGFSDVEVLPLGFPAGRLFVAHR